MTEWHPVNIHPYQNKAWYQLNDNALSIRVKSDCGKLMHGVAEQSYVDDLLGVDLQSADDDILQMVVGGVLQDDVIQFHPLMEVVK